MVAEERCLKSQSEKLHAPLLRKKKANRYGYDIANSKKQTQPCGTYTTKLKNNAVLNAYLATMLYVLYV